jgi:hypothetical protein
MGNEDQIMLFLYKDIGLYWEQELKKDEHKDRCSMTKNTALKDFFLKQNAITYNLTNARNMEQKDIQDNELYFTDSKSSVARSLLHHLRNSIMHGLYTIKQVGSQPFIEFYDLHPGLNRTTLKGRVEFAKLKAFMDVIKSY